MTVMNPIPPSSRPEEKHEPTPPTADTSGGGPAPSLSPEIIDPTTGKVLPLAKTPEELRQLFKDSPYFFEPTADPNYKPFLPEDAD